MAQLKKIDDLSLDTSKTAVICGKGPTLSNIDAIPTCRLDDFYFFGINHAYKLMPKIDFIIVSDVNVMEDMDKDPTVYDRVKNYIIPLVLRETVDKQGPVDSTNKTYKYFLDKLKNHDANVFTYKLFTQAMKGEVQLDVDTSQQDDFLIGSTTPPHTVYSNCQVALLWCIRAGFRDYAVFGTSRKNEYSQTFIDMNVDMPKALAGRQWFKTNYDASITILEENNCTYKIF